MAKSTCSSISSISSPISSSSSSSVSSPPISEASISSPSSRKSKSSSASDKALSFKSSSSIDRRKRLAANARERKRMHLLNKAYDELRLRLADAENKSKYDVLVQAKEYIQALATICEKFDQENSVVRQEGQTTQYNNNNNFKNHHHQYLSHPPSCSNAHIHQLDLLNVQTAPVDMTTYNPGDQNHLKNNLSSPQKTHQYTTFSHQRQQRITFT